MQFLFSNKLSDASLSRTLADTGRLPLSPHRGEAGGKQKRPQVVACDPSKTKGETRATNADLGYHRFGGSPRESSGRLNCIGCSSAVPRKQTQERTASEGGPYTSMNDLAAGDRGDEEDVVAVFQRAGFTAEEANVFFVEIDVEELADLPLFIADVTRERWIARGQVVEGFGDGGGGGIELGDAVGEATERSGDYDSDGHS